MKGGPRFESKANLLVAIDHLRLAARIHSNVRGHRASSSHSPNYCACCREAHSQFSKLKSTNLGHPFGQYRAQVVKSWLLVDNLKAGLLLRRTKVHLRGHSPGRPAGRRDSLPSLYAWTGILVR